MGARLRSAPVVGLMQNHNYRLFFCGQVISVVGTWAFNTYLLWVMLDQERSGRFVGVVVGVTLLPLGVVTPFGGSIADRFDRKNVITYCYGASAAVVAAVVAAQLVWSRNLLVLALAAVLLNALGAIEAPARQVFLFDLVGLEHLQPAIVMTGATFNIGRLAGPALAATVISAGDAELVVVVNAVSFLAACFSAAAIRRSALTPLGHIAVPGWGNALREMRRVPSLILVFLVYSVVGTLALNDAISVPLLSDAVFGADASELGLLLSSVAAGSLVGGLLMLLSSAATPRRLAGALVWFGVVNAVYGALRGTASLVVVGFLLGTGATAVIVLSQTLVQTLSPDSVRGRTVALFFTVTFGSYVIGAPLLGWAADVRGADGPFLVATSACVLGLALLLAAPVLERRLVGRAVTPVDGRGVPTLAAPPAGPPSS